MELDLSLQKIWQGPTPSTEHFENWVRMALDQAAAFSNDRYELCIRVEDITGSGLLNEHYRHRLGPTNVLAFSYNAPLEPSVNLLGDLVICGPLVWSEAAHWKKDVQEHWALLTVHGVLHLLGYDHQSDSEWQEMAGLESAILTSFDMSPPYPSQDTAII